MFIKRKLDCKNRVHIPEDILKASGIEYNSEIFIGYDDIQKNIVIKKVIEDTKCCFCGKVFENVYDKNDASPIMPGSYCCSDCNWKYIIPTRVRLSTK